MPIDPTPIPPSHPTGHEASAPAGRPAVGVDLGGSGFRVVLVDPRGRPTASRTVSWGGAGVAPPPDEALARVARAVRELEGPDDAPVGLAVPGTVDRAGDRVGRAANLGWEEVPLADLAARVLGVAVRVVHDARAAAEAERRNGSATAAGRTLVVPIGTGISAALVAGDRVVPDLAGELGHLDVGTGLRCTCGASGCLETVAAASSIGRRWRARTELPPPGDGAREVVDALLAGDGNAAAVWGDAVEALATALLTATRLLAPDRVVLAGGLAGAGSRLSDPVRAALAPRTGFQRAPEVVTSSLGPLAGALGAAAWSGDDPTGSRDGTTGGPGGPEVAPC